MKRQYGPAVSQTAKNVCLQTANEVAIMKPIVRKCKHCGSLYVDYGQCMDDKGGNI